MTLSAGDLVERFETLDSERAPFLDVWQRIAEIMFPLRADFMVRSEPARNRVSTQFDTTAANALDNLASGLWGWATNSSTRWFSLQPEFPEIARDRDAQLWLDDAEAKMRGAFEARGQRFYSRLLDAYRDLIAFGTAIFYVEEDEAGGIFPCTYSLATTVIATDDRDVVDTVIRRFSFTGRQMLRRWRDALPPRLADACERAPFGKHDVLHAVMPRDEWEGRTGAAVPGRAKRFASFFVTRNDPVILSEGGYDSFPYAVPRWSTLTGETYGESPGMLALADARMVNQMARSVLLAVERQNDPPILQPDDGTFRPEEELAPGVRIVGGVDAVGRPLYRPMEFGSRPDLASAVAEPHRLAIRRTFLSDLLQLVQQDRMTATEVLERRQETLRLIGPQLARVQAELLDPIITRAFDILVDQRAFAPLPPSLAAAPGLRVQYGSPMSRAQRLGEAQSALQALSAVLPLAQVDPEVVEEVDLPAAARSVLGAFGVPAEMLRDPALVAARRQARAQAQAQQAQLMQQAQAAETVERLAGAAQRGAGAAAQAAAVPPEQAGGAVVPFAR
ncbi:head-tail connector protein [Leptolyngbya sp. 15MV]|nr:head-tail connector protein [Leptolyngbya sp. 15MV]